MSLHFPNQLQYRSLKGYHISQQEFPHDRDEQKLKHNFMIIKKSPNYLIILSFR